MCLGVAVPIFGCRGKSGSSGAQEPPKIELWDGQAKVTESLHAEVKYRFVQGQPQPDREYWFELEMGIIYTLAKVMGKDLKAEGQFQVDSPLLHKEQSYTMKVLESGPNGSGPYHLISNELKGTLQPMLLKQ
jgi:hypothetical protein